MALEAGEMENKTPETPRHAAMVHGTMDAFFISQEELASRKT